MEEGVIKEGLLSCVKSIDLGRALIVGGGKIYRSKSWHCLGPPQSSKLELFAKIVFGCYPLTFFCKKLQLRCLTSSM